MVNLNNRIKSPLRYVGGKSRAVSIILNLIPEDIKSVISPFFGGGSVELALVSTRNVKVKGFDVFRPLTTFWNVLLKHPHKLERAVLNYYPLNKNEFYLLQKILPYLKDELQMATIYYVLNRCSFSGTTLRGGMVLGHDRFTHTGINKIGRFKVDGLSVNNLDFKQSIQNNNQHFMYLDPPYDNSLTLYGKDRRTHLDFDHLTLSLLLKESNNWLLSYNDCEYIRHLYKGLRYVKPFWHYGAGKNKLSNELLIFSRNYNKAISVDGVL